MKEREIRFLSHLLRLFRKSVQITRQNLPVTKMNLHLHQSRWYSPDTTSHNPKIAPIFCQLLVTNASSTFKTLSRVSHHPLMTYRQRRRDACRSNNDGILHQQESPGRQQISCYSGASFRNPESGNPSG